MPAYYDILINKYYNNIIKYDTDKTYENEDVLSLITSFSNGASFSNGTVYGFSGLYYMLNKYIDNFNTYKDRKLIVYEKS